MADTTRNDGFQQAALSILNAVKEGVSVDPDSYAGRYPDCAHEVRAFIEDLRLSQQIKLQFGSTGLPAPASGPSMRHPVHVALTCESGFSEIAGYRILEEIGSGGQGVVYKAEQFGTKRLAALKFLEGGVRASSPKRQRFRNEVELISRLRHPNIVSVYACGDYQGLEFFAMEYIEGVPLDVYLAGETRPPAEILELFLQITDAIRYAHQVGVIHRDLKPTNVLVDAQGRAHVLDFGLAKAFGGEEPGEGGAMTRAGDFAGTWHWASPEQIRGDTAVIDVRTDVYALGMILYQMLTDNFPYAFERDTRETIARHVLSVPPRPPRAICGEVDEDAETIILRCLAKEPAERYPTVEALHADVKRYLAGEPIEARRDSALYVLKKTVRRYRRLAIAAGAAAATLMVFAAVTFILYTRSQAARAEVEVKSGIDLNSRVRLGEHVNELNHAVNHLEAFLAAYPDGAAAARLLRNRKTVSEALFNGLNLNPDWFASGAVTDWADNPVIVDWLSAHTARLNEIQTTLRDHRVVFGEPDAEDLALPMVRNSDYFVTAEAAAKALVVMAYRDGEPTSSVSLLETALRIAMDLGDAPSLHPKIASMNVRSIIYDTILILLSTRAIDANANAYLNWISSDPPLPRYSMALIATRENLVKLIRDASTGEAPGDVGYVDLNRLDAQLDGMFRTLGLYDREFVALCRSTSPQKLLDLLDVYTTQVHEWDNLTVPELEQARQKSQLVRQEQPEFAILKLFLPDKTPAFAYRRQVMSKQVAVRLAADVLRFRLSYGVWPEPTNAASPRPSLADAPQYDPYSGHELRYRLSPATPFPAPIVYSINLDGVDDGGAPGPWGQPGTDVVLWRYSPAQDNQD